MRWGAVSSTRLPSRSNRNTLSQSRRGRPCSSGPALERPCWKSSDCDSTPRASSDEASSRSTVCARAVAERASSSSIRSCSLRTSVKICKLMMAAIGNVASKMTAIRYVRSEAVGQEPSNRSMSRCRRRIVVGGEPGKRNLDRSLRQFVQLRQPSAVALSCDGRAKRVSKGVPAQPLVAQLCRFFVARFFKRHKARRRTRRHGRCKRNCSWPQGSID